MDALLRESGLEDEYLATLDDLNPQELMAEVGSHVVSRSNGETAPLERPLAEHVARLGKRRRIGLAYLQHAPVEKLAARGEVLAWKRGDLTQRHADRAAWVAKPAVPHGGRWPHRLLGPGRAARTSRRPRRGPGRAS